jgi:hypothetical protein
MGVVVAVWATGAAAQSAVRPLQETNGALLEQIERVQHLTDRQVAALRAIFARSPYIGQGNPAVTRHPLTPEQCGAKAREAGVVFENPDFERICGAPYMSPLYDPATQRIEDARACIDQFEFPDIPCAYPLVWTRAREAAEICEAVGKRLCDAHEWEGACAGELLEPDYRFDLAEGVPPSVAIERMAREHNAADAGKEVWSYGDRYQRGICATGSLESPQCDGGSFALCGSNTYPAGSFPDCRSKLGVYDLNGNAAEIMNLPLGSSQMASGGSRELGYTELKGSWFIFDSYRAHPDQCRWRAPYWHGTRVMAENSHRNYHLGFRCCSTLTERGPALVPPPLPFLPPGAENSR